MSTLLAVATFIKTYPNLETGAPVTVDYAGENPAWYSILPTPSNPVIETYISGKEKRQFTFVFQAVGYTADDIERIDNISFFEAFASWLKSQTNSKILPVLEVGQTPQEIEALTWAYLFEEGVSDTGIYQIQCRLVYIQA